MSEHRETLILADGRARAARAWRPAAGNELGLARFLLLHGMESHSGWFAALGEALAARGASAFAVDRPGWGESAGRRGDVRRADDALHEVRMAMGGERCHLVGLSWGGLPAALSEAASVTLIAPALFPRKKLRPLDYAKAAAGVGLVRLPLAVADFTKIPAQQAFVAQDPLRVTAVTGRFLFVTWALMRKARAAAAQAPVRSLLLAGDDTMIDNERTARFAGERGYELAVHAGAAHSLVLEDPAWVADRLVATALKAEGRPA